MDLKGQYRLTFHPTLSYFNRKKIILIKDIRANRRKYN